ncbi:MAG: HDOD domain-containing protein [Proteobacteria bacterium]|nr:HDOD domain-containing protein [Desulfobacula sp.]MBU3952810.1 HDOD domain-containing protein [Pseudomonadota bacterium]MBU4131789.1 HDOD domain-containing protein [Pseudomonadota bacterium]
MKILIVDDESISRKILVRHMEALGECVAMDNSRKALAEFEVAVEQGHPFDFVSLDVSMPGMDGQQMLAQIRKQEAARKISRADRVKVIMVSSRMNMATIKACIKLGCNGYLSKPVSKYQLWEAMGKMGFDIAVPQKESEESSYPGMITEIIQRFYKGKISLPVFPHIVKEIQECLEGDSPSMEDLARIVEKDIVISSKLISIANSPLYKGIDTVNSLNAALLRLGMKATQGVISAVAARNMFASKNKSLKRVLENLWMHSFAVACLGKRLGEALKVEHTENIFLMGIVHDIGKMLLMKAIVDLFPEESVEETELQQAIHEIHTTFGAALLKKMRFSNEFIPVAEFHHWNAYPKDTAPELLIINLADHLSCEIGFGFTEVESQSPSSIKQLGLDPDLILEICGQVKSMLKESARAF